MQTRPRAIVKMLQQVYPRALSYSDIMRALADGGASAYYSNKPSGKLLTTLCKRGEITKITVGFYAATSRGVS